MHFNSKEYCDHKQIDFQRYGDMRGLLKCKTIIFFFLFSAFQLKMVNFPLRFFVILVHQPK